MQSQVRRRPILLQQPRRGAEKRRMLKMSVRKLRKLEDPEARLRRAVLINNTLVFLRGGEGRRGKERGASE